ncbi:MAG: hypothetical protein ACRD8O_15435 [Bryobacteraceae bacterium]
MPEIRFRDRRAVSIENDVLRVTVLAEGGHVAGILDKRSQMNPLWLPPWRSIEPSSYDPAKHPEYGNNVESRLLAGIMGHNLCLDVFGGPSEAEAAAGIGVHGEGSVVRYAISESGTSLLMRADLPLAHLRFERRIRLDAGSRVVRFTETAENVSATDRPAAWTHHVTLGPPFLEKGSTEFRVPATRSKVYETDFTGGKGYVKTGAEFDWPNVPRIDGGATDLRIFTNAAVSGGYTAHLMDPARDQVFFAAFSPRANLVFGYAWKREDFPWLGIWEENHSRDHAPWNGKTLARGMEFGVSPMPETRRQMIDRGSLFGVPGYRWIPAKSRVTVDFCAFLLASERAPESVQWDEQNVVTLE